MRVKNPVLFCVTFFTAALAFAGDDIGREDLSLDDRVHLLEAKADSHDKALAEKLNECRLEYRKLGRRATWCPEGSVVTEVEKIYGTELLNVSCAKPVLVCDKLGIKVEL